MSNRYNIQLSLKVDEDANFLEADREATLSVLEDLISAAIYDIDDVKLLYIEVEQDD